VLFAVAVAVVATVVVVDVIVPVEVAAVAVVAHVFRFRASRGRFSMYYRCFMLYLIQSHFLLTQVT